MSDAYLRKPLGQSLNDLSRQRALDAIQLLGKALPASIVAVNKAGAIVTVKFELGAIPFTLPRVKVPVLTSEYIRAPLPVGCRGFVIPADAYLGGMSGLGGGTADLTQQSNLGALVFAPIGNLGFQDVGPNVVTLYGPGGVTIRDSGGTCKIELTPGGIVITLPGGGNVTVVGGDVIADGISLKTHRHSAVQPGGGTSGPPT